MSTLSRPIPDAPFGPHQLALLVGPEAASLFDTMTWMSAHDSLGGEWQERMLPLFLDRAAAYAGVTQQELEDFLERMGKEDKEWQWELDEAGNV